jgi:hypothetical protein
MRQTPDPSNHQNGDVWRAFHKSAAFTIGTNDALLNDRIISASAALAT